VLAGNQRLKVDELPDVLRSVFDPAPSLSELQTTKSRRGFDTEAALRVYLGDPPPGYEWHHNIEQSGQWRPDLTSPEWVQTWIQNTENMVLVPVIKHYCLSGIMSRASGVEGRIRDIVRHFSPERQRDVGLELLSICRVTS
jgi:hypothetical protein